MYQYFISFCCQIIFCYIICHSAFIHSSVDGHLNCFCFLAIMNNVAMNFHIQILVWMYALASLGVIYLGVELLGHMIMSLFNVILLFNE